ncbi:MAG: hypothetical protein J0I41_05005 [Filimonas sp.]|nr:hypothetical protein [Filimonas sp.]
MKSSVLFFLSFLIVKSVCGQDVSDEKNMGKLKSSQFVLADKENKRYSVVLSDHSFLDIKYNVVEDGEMNASYTFMKNPLTFTSKNSPAANFEFVKTNFVFYATSIGLTQAQISNIQQLLSASVFSDISKPVFVNLSLKGYDESNFSFFNLDNMVYCRLFFRRLL